MPSARNAEMKPRDPDWDAKVRASFARQTFMNTIGARMLATMMCVEGKSELPD